MELYPEGRLAKAAAMGHAEAEIDIARQPDEVWAVVGDFGGLDNWLQSVESCRLEGENRVLSMMNMEITETLRRKDDDARQLVYGITAGVPVQHHEATITVAPGGDGSHVTWAVDTDDAMTDMMIGIYQQGLQALKQHVESP